MFYDNYIQLCNSVGKSPSAVALELGLYKSTVSNWKNRGTYPTDATLRKISSYFGCTVADLLCDENEEKPAPVRSELSKKEQLLNLIDGMSRAELIDTLKAVAARLEDEK